MTALLLAISMGLFQFEGNAEQADQLQLARRIKETLVQIDEALLEATEVDAVTDQIAKARQMHINNIRDIERLIETMKYQMMNPPPNGGSSSGQQGQGQGQGQGKQPQPRSSDGSTKPEGGAPDQQQEEGQEVQPASDEAEDGSGEGGRPKDGTGDRRSGDLPPVPDDISDFTRPNTDGRWGLLPPKVQEQLNNLHVDDVPARYRDWLDAYIQAMRKLEQP